jgi:tetratricopeptide (TPR) repeat protein
MATLLSRHIGLFIALIISVFVLLPTLQNEILHWDDEVYITTNDLVKDLSFKKVGDQFSTTSVNSNYHPLTLFSWSIDHSIGGLDPFVYHLHNLILHLLNILLVYIFVLLLAKKPLVAAIVALLFGMHPMHIESIAWISARKDLLYSFYYLITLIVYVKYAQLKNLKKKYLVLCLGCFLMALLSKGMAITLPFILLIIDYWLHRTINRKVLLEKIPFFLLAIGFGIVGYMVQGEALNSSEEIPIYNRFFVATYNVIIYMVKVVFPVGLSSFHPYPSNLPWYLYSSSILVLVLLVWLYFKRKANRTLLFGFAFFLISLTPVLQIVAFGQAIHAERYTYLPYLGLFLLFAIGFDWLFTRFKKRKFQLIPIAFGCILIGLLSFHSFSRSKVWKNDETLWENVLEQYPGSHFAWANLGNNQFELGKNEKALTSYNHCLELESGYYLANLNRGIIYQERGKFHLALADFEKAISISNHPKAHLNKGAFLVEMGNDSLALSSFLKAVRLDTNYATAHFNLGGVYFRQGATEKAISSFNLAEENGFIHPMLYIMRARLHQGLGEAKKAEQDLITCVEQHSKHISGHVELGWHYIKNDDSQKAIAYFSNALELDSKNRNALVNRGLAFYLLGQYNRALIDLDLAQTIDSTFYPTFHNKALVHQKLGNRKMALIEFNKAIALSDSAANILTDLDFFLEETVE